MKVVFGETYIIKCKQQVKLDSTSSTYSLQVSRTYTLTLVAFDMGIKYHPRSLLCNSLLFAYSWPPLMQQGLRSLYTCSFAPKNKRYIHLCVHWSIIKRICLPAQEVISCRMGRLWRSRLMNFKAIFKKTIAKN